MGVDGGGGDDGDDDCHGVGDGDHGDDDRTRIMVVAAAIMVMTVWYG